MSNTVLLPEARRAERMSASGLTLLIAALVVGGGVVASAILSRVPAMAGWMSVWWPFVVLVISVGLIITLITVVRLPAFLSLVAAAVAAGLLSRVGGLPGDPGKNHWIQAVELTAQGFGQMAGGIAIVIVLASVIGVCLLESGAADKIVRRFLAVFGERHAALALLASTYFVSIPIFFDTIFMLLLPLARALRLRTGKDYLLYILAICCAGVVTHSMVIPHPGPLAMAEALKVDVGMSILVGWFTGIIPVGAGFLVAMWLNSRVDVPLVETPGASLEELQAIMDKPEDELPSLWVAVTPVILPVLLISAASVVAAIGQERLVGWFDGAVGGPENAAAVVGYLGGWTEFLGNRNVALIIGTIVAIGILIRQRGIGLREVGRLIGPPMETAGMIILITSAGGAFGMMLRNAGVGDAIKSAAGGYEVNLIVLSWLVALVIRVAQGSATVAMLTTSSMILPLMSGSALPYHPVYIFMAIGYGAMGVSWMNDSGFWLVSRLGGLSEQQTLKTWTVVLTVLSVAGLITALVLARIMPMALPAN